MIDINNPELQNLTKEENFNKKICEKFFEQKIILTKEQAEKFFNYNILLREWNEKINLTTIIQEDEVINKHFLDSVVSEKYIFEKAKVIDLGSGAGFPGIPLKIIRSDIDITLVDSVNKKVNFLNEVIAKLQLKNAKAYHTRIEDFANKTENRENFDFVVSRAVSKLNTLCEYALPFLKVGGKLIAYKSIETEIEVAEARNSINLLGGKIEKIIKIPFENMERNLIIIKKIGITPKKYPRSGNKPRLSPII